MSRRGGGLFDFRSKEEKARIYEAYVKQIFPYGDSQREKVLGILADMFPKERLKPLMMHYILIKEEMTDENPLDFETAARKVEKKKLVRITPELHTGMQVLLNIDLGIDERLEYPSLEELKKEISSLGHTI